MESFTSKMRRQTLRKTEFDSKLMNSPDVPHMKVDDIYTNMIIQLGRKKDKFCGNRSEMLHAYTKSTNISIDRAEELFQPIANTEDPKSILIRGKPGIGKTLFCQMLVRDWAKECLFSKEKDKNKFQFVFLFTFRQLNSIDELLTLYEFLRDCSPETCPEITKDVYDFIISNPENALLVFDGFDEFKYQQEMQHKSVGDKMTVGTLFARIAAGELLANATVVITTRPEAEANLEDLKIQRSVEMLGFNKDHVRKYVDKFFNKLNSDQMEKVLEYILSNENIATFCYVPVNCFLVCSYVEWYLSENPGPVSASFPSTIAELYLEVVKMFLQKHHKECRGQKNPLLPSSAQYALDRLCQLSLKLLKNKIYVFSDEDLENFCFKKEEIHPLLSSGLLHCIPKVRTGFSNTKTYYCFLHLTLQEFLAACSLIKSGELFQMRKSATGFPELSEMVFLFIAGLLGTLVRKCGENVFGLSITKENADKIMSSLTKFPRHHSYLVELLYNYKEKQFIQSLLQEGVCAFLEVEGQLTTYQALAFLLMMQVEPKYQVQEVVITYFTDQGISEYIAEALKCEYCQLRSIEIVSCILTDMDMKRLGDALTSSNCHLETLHFDLIFKRGGAKFSDREAEHITQALASPNCCLKEFCFDEGRISDKGAELFSYALTHCWLTVLSLAHNPIGDKGAKHFSQALTSFDCHLEELCLDGTQISDKGAEHFCHALASSNCHLAVLSLAENEISDKGAEHFSHALTRPNCHLTVLNLAKNQISDKGVEHFIHALTNRLNCHLEVLHLLDNQTCDKGAANFGLTLPDDSDYSCSLSYLQEIKKGIYRGNLVKEVLENHVN